MYKKGWSREAGEEIARKRTARKWSRAMLSRLTGVSHSTIVRIEEGKSEVGIAAYIACCNAFGCTLDALIAREKEDAHAMDGT